MNNDFILVVKFIEVEIKIFEVNVEYVNVLSEEDS